MLFPVFTVAVCPVYTTQWQLHWHHSNSIQQHLSDLLAWTSWFYTCWEMDWWFLSVSRIMERLRLHWNGIFYNWYCNRDAPSAALLCDFEDVAFTLVTECVQHGHSGFPPEDALQLHVHSQKCLFHRGRNRHFGRDSINTDWGGCSFNGWAIKHIYSIVKTWKSMLLFSSWVCKLIIHLASLFVFGNKTSHLLSFLQDWNSTSYGPASPCERGDGAIVLPMVLHSIAPTYIFALSIGALCAAVMSSADSFLLSATTIFTTNIYQTIRSQVLSGNMK